MAVKCDQCSYEGRDTGTLNDHIKAVHEKVKRYFCDLCDYASYFKGKLVRHKKAKHGSKMVKICSIKPKEKNEKNTNKELFCESSKNKITPNAVEYKCNICTEVTYITMIKVNQF